MGRCSSKGRPLLAELLGFAAEGLDGHGRLVFLGGEAGVGKTSLTRALAAELAGRCAVQVGAVDNLTTADALAAFTDALRGLAPRPRPSPAVLVPLVARGVSTPRRCWCWRGPALGGRGNALKRTPLPRPPPRRVAADPDRVATYRHDEVSTAAPAHARDGRTRRPTGGAPPDRPSPHHPRGGAAHRAVWCCAGRGRPSRTYGRKRLLRHGGAGHRVTGHRGTCHR